MDELFGFFTESEETTEAYYEEEEEQQQQPPAGYPPVTTEAYYEEEEEQQQQQPPAGYPPISIEAYYEEEEEEQQQPPIGYPPVGDINLNNNNYCPTATTSNHNPMMMNQPPAQNYQSAGPNIVLAQPSHGIPTYKKRIAVIGSKYCSPDPVDLIIKRKVFHLSHGNFIVEDVNRNLMFKIKDGIQLLRDRRVLRDAEGKPIVTMQEKILTAHDRWNAFKGDNRDPCNLLFCAKLSSLIQFRTKLDVFLASNGTEGPCDFKVKGSWSERSCVIYDVESNNIIAQMHKKITVGSMLIGKDKFMVTVYPNVDSAFIVALIVILDAINE